MNKRYSCDGFRSVIVDRNGIMSNGDVFSSDVFAKRAARREFGRSGQVGAFRLDSWSEDGSSAVYEAFIGCHSPYGGISGHNIWLYVHCEDVK